MQVQAEDHLLNGEAGTVQLPAWGARDGRGSWEPKNLGRRVLGHLSASALLHSFYQSVITHVPHYPHGKLEPGHEASGERQEALPSRT